VVGVLQKRDIQDRVTVGKIHAFHTETAQYPFDLLFVGDPAAVLPAAAAGADGVSRPGAGACAPRGLS
jgi:hypothetical protein